MIIRFHSLMIGYFQLDFGWDENVGKSKVGIMRIIDEGCREELSHSPILLANCGVGHV